MNTSQQFKSCWIISVLYKFFLETKYRNFVIFFENTKNNIENIEIITFNISHIKTAELIIRHRNVLYNLHKST
jgi:hypothetical protein